MLKLVILKDREDVAIYTLSVCSKNEWCVRRLLVQMQHADSMLATRLLPEHRT